MENEGYQDAETDEYPQIETFHRPKQPEYYVPKGLIRKKAEEILSKAAESNPVNPAYISKAPLDITFQQLEALANAKGKRGRPSKKLLEIRKQLTAEDREQLIVQDPAYDLETILADIMNEVTQDSIQVEKCMFYRKSGEYDNDLITPSEPSELAEKLGDNAIRAVGGVLFQALQKLTKDAEKNRYIRANEIKELLCKYENEDGEKVFYDELFGLLFNPMRPHYETQLKSMKDWEKWKFLFNELFTNENIGYILENRHLFDENASISDIDIRSIKRSGHEEPENVYKPLKFNGNSSASKGPVVDGKYSNGFKTGDPAKAEAYKRVTRIRAEQNLARTEESMQPAQTGRSVYSLFN